MTSLDECYRQLLLVGFVVLRQARDAADLDWLTAELTFLHNIPSLIGEPNQKRHEYFWTQERQSYIDWVSVPGREFQKSRMMTYYAPILNELAGLMPN